MSILSILSATLAGIYILVESERPELFRDREGKNNEQILALLAQQKLTAYQISIKLGRKAYATIFDRLRDLESREIIEKQGKTRAAKSHAEIPLWGLTAYGLCLGATQDVNLDLRNWSLRECQRRLSAHWEVFWKLYDFDASKESGRIDYVKRWMRTDESTIQILQTFGHTPLEGEAQALVVFRRMLDIGILLVQSQNDFALPKLGDFQRSNFVQPLTNLAEIAINHPKLRKLHATIKEIDTPMYERIRSNTFEQTVTELSKCVPEECARKLASTPLLKNYPLPLMTNPYIVEASVDRVIETAVALIKAMEAAAISTKHDTGPTVMRSVGVKVAVIDNDQLNIVTTANASEISGEWRRQANAIHVIDAKGHVKVLKSKKVKTK